MAIRLNCPLCAQKGCKPEDNRHDPARMVMYRQANVCKSCAGEREAAVHHVTHSEWKWTIKDRHGHGTCDTQDAVVVLKIPFEAIGTENTVVIQLANGKEAPKVVEKVETPTVSPTVKRRRKKTEDAAPVGEDSDKDS